MNELYHDHTMRIDCTCLLQMMQSNIDGMMANYDQISAEREELLESLADVRQYTSAYDGNMYIT